MSVLDSLSCIDRSGSFTINQTRKIRFLMNFAHPDLKKVTTNNKNPCPHANAFRVEHLPVLKGEPYPYHPYDPKVTRDWMKAQEVPFPNSLPEVLCKVDMVSKQSRAAQQSKLRSLRKGVIPLSKLRISSNRRISGPAVFNRRCARFLLP